jgi:hypothetical protein
MTTDLRRQIARLQRQLEEQERVVWILVRRLGGEISVTDAELTGIPAHASLMKRTESGRHRIAAFDARDHPEGRNKT